MGLVNSKEDENSENSRLEKKGDPDPDENFEAQDRVELGKEVRRVDETTEREEQKAQLDAFGSASK